MAIDLLKLAGRDNPIPTPSVPVSTGPPKPGAKLAEEFQKIFGDQLAELVNVTQESARLDRDFAAGVEGVGIDDVMISAAKSGLAVDAALQIRNLAFRAFQTLTQLR